MDIKNLTESKCTTTRC